MSNLIAHTANHEDRIQLLSDHIDHVSERMLSTLEPIGLSNMGYLIGLLHDIGKAHPDWQTYINDPKNVRVHPGHAQYGRIVYNTYLFPLINEDIDVEEDYRYAIAQVICSHHSALHDDVNFDNMAYDLVEEWKKAAAANSELDISVFKRCFDEEDDIQRIRDIFIAGYVEFAKIRGDIYTRNEKQYSSDIAACVTGRTFELNLLNALLLSALMDADWLDTQNHEDGIYETVKQCVPDWNRYIEPLEERVSQFKPNTSLNKLRIMVSDACHDAGISDSPQSVRKLSVFCGGGKTLASTRYALQHAQYNSKRHVFYIIPFTSIIEQNAEVLRCFCAAGDNDLLEHHSNAGLDANSDIKEIAERTADDDFSKKTVSRYDVPIVMTTQVRFLMSLFSKDKRNRRLFCDYINSEIIFDEFQAMPIKLLDMFYIAIEFMTNVMHCNIVLCSATQMTNSNFGVSNWSFLTGVDWNAKYANTLGRAKFLDLSNYSNKQAPVMTLGSVGDLMETELEDRNSVLVIVNSRAQARDLFQNLDIRLQDARVYHLSTNMYPRHRKQVLDDMMTALSDKTEKVVCVSTSLIEAGVDVSFDTVIRYLNGFDSIVQSGGRCNRHAQNNVEGRVYIVNEPRAIPMYKSQQESTAIVLNKYSKNLTNKLVEGLALYYSTYISYVGTSTTKFKFDYQGNVSYSTTLVDLWGDNPQYTQHHPSRLPFSSNGSEMPRRHSLVRTAQRAFSVIDDNNNEVIVCQDERCRELLDAYIEADSFKVLRELQRQLQQYSVSLTQGDFWKIHDWLKECPNDNLGTSVTIIEESSVYDVKCGIMPSNDSDFIL